MVYKVIEKIPEWCQGDFYEDYVGLNKVTYCTVGFIKNLLRKIFDNRTLLSPLMAITYRDNNKLYCSEGVFLNGWVTNCVDQTEQMSVNFYNGQGCHSINPLFVEELWVDN